MNVKYLSLRIIKFIPFFGFKVFLLRNVFGYSIGRNVRIGKSVINYNKVSIGDNVYIADKNSLNCNELTLGNNTSIYSGNIIQGTANFTVGNNSRIINNHFFDLWNNIQIGSNTWIAGKNSQFWTHESIHTKNKEKDLSIRINDHVYIGSGSLFAPGVKIESVNLIGLGSVVSGVFEKKSYNYSG